MGRGVGGISATNAEGLGGTCFGKTRFKISDGIRLLKYKYPPEPARIRIRNKKKRIEVEVQDRLAVERDQQMKRHEPRTIKKQYAYFIDCTNVRPNWQPLDRLNKKKKIESYY